MDNKNSGCISSLIALVWPFVIAFLVLMALAFLTDWGDSDNGDGWRYDPSIRQMVSV